MSFTESEDEPTGMPDGMFPSSLSDDVNHEVFNNPDDMMEEHPPFSSAFLTKEFQDLRLVDQIKNPEYLREYKDFFYPIPSSNEEPVGVVSQPPIGMEESVVDINYVLENGVLKIHIPSNTRKVSIEMDGKVVTIDSSSFVGPRKHTKVSSGKRDRVPFLPEEREYIMGCYHNLVKSGYISKAACARMIWNEIYSNVEVDTSNEIVNRIRRPLRKMGTPTVKKNRTFKSILNLIYNRTTKRNSQ